MLPRAGHRQRSAPQRFGTHLWRNVIHFLGQVLWVYSIGALALATVFAIEFTMPVWTAILAWLFLQEKLTFPRLVMLGLGLVGVLIILRPGQRRVPSGGAGDDPRLAVLRLVLHLHQAPVVDRQRARGAVLDVGGADADLARARACRNG